MQVSAGGFPRKTPHFLIDLKTPMQYSASDNSLLFEQWLL